MLVLSLNHLHDVRHVHFVLILMFLGPAPAICPWDPPHSAFFSWRRSHASLLDVVWTLDNWLNQLNHRPARWKAMKLSNTSWSTSSATSLRKSIYFARWRFANKQLSLFCHRPSQSCSGCFSLLLPNTLSNRGKCNPDCLIEAVTRRSHSLHSKLWISKQGSNASGSTHSPTLASITFWKPIVAPHYLAPSPVNLSSNVYRVSALPYWFKQFEVLNAFVVVCK